MTSQFPFSNLELENVQDMFGIINDEKLNYSIEEEKSSIDSDLEKMINHIPLKNIVGSQPQTNTKDINVSIKKNNKNYLEEFWKMLVSCEKDLKQEKLLVDNNLNEIENAKLKKYELRFNTHIRNRQFNNVDNSDPNTVRESSILPRLVSLSLDVDSEIYCVNDFKSNVDSLKVNKIVNEVLFCKKSILDSPFEINTLYFGNINTIQQRWANQIKSINNLHFAIDSKISEKFEDPLSRNKVSMHKALLLKSYLNCRLGNWQEAEIGAVDSFRFGQINKDNEIISQSLLLLIFILNKRKEFERLFHVLNNLLNSEISEEFPEILFLVSLYLIDLQTKQINLEGPSPFILNSLAFKKVLDKFANCYNKKSDLSLLSRTINSNVSQIMSTSLFLHFSNDYFALSSCFIKPSISKLFMSIGKFSDQLSYSLYNWLYSAFDFNLTAFFEILSFTDISSLFSSDCKRLSDQENSFFNLVKMNFCDRLGISSFESVKEELQDKEIYHHHYVFYIKYLIKRQKLIGVDKIILSMSEKAKNQGLSDNFVLEYKIRQIELLIVQKQFDKAINKIEDCLQISSKNMKLKLHFELNILKVEVLIKLKRNVEAVYLISYVYAQSEYFSKFLRSKLTYLFSLARLNIMKDQFKEKLHQYDIFNIENDLVNALVVSIRECQFEQCQKILMLLYFVSSKSSEKTYWKNLLKDVQQVRFFFVKNFEKFFYNNESNFRMKFMKLIKAVHSVSVKLTIKLNSRSNKNKL